MTAAEELIFAADVYARAKVRLRHPFVSLADMREANEHKRMARRHFMRAWSRWRQEQDR